MFKEWFDKLPEDKKAKLNITRTNLDKCLDENSRNLYYLKSRWNDEKEYEDFDEYAKIFKDTFKKYGFEDISLTKSFKVTLKHLNWKTQFKLNYNGITFKYDYIK